MKQYLFFASMLMFLASGCDEAGTESSGDSSATPETVTIGDYELEAVAGSDCQLAIKMDTAGLVLERGMVCDGVRSGTWTFYTAEQQALPEKLVTYVAGNYSGTYLQFNERGQVELLATYKENKLDGPWGKYRFGRPEIEATYVDGELDGIYREYDFRNGVMKKEISYKGGKEDGAMRFFDEEGNIVLEYTYRDGQKISESTPGQ